MRQKKDEYIHEKILNNTLLQKELFYFFYFKGAKLQMFRVIIRIFTN